MYLTTYITPYSTPFSALLTIITVYRGYSYTVAIIVTWLFCCGQCYCGSYALASITVAIMACFGFGYFNISQLLLTLFSVSKVID